jgi:hypothetical protein
MKPRHIALGAALAIAAGFAVFGDKTPNSPVAEAVVRGAAPFARPAAPVAATGASATKGAPEPAILRLIPRADLIPDGAEALGGAENLFLSQDWNPPPAPPSAASQPPPPPPTAPPLPFTYLGKAVGEGAWEVYLARGDKTYVVHPKEVVDGVYRVDAIAPPTITFTYLPLNQVQQLNIGVFD